jgi:hypothetical protein
MASDDGAVFLKSMELRVGGEGDERRVVGFALPPDEDS